MDDEDSLRRQALAFPTVRIEVYLLLGVLLDVLRSLLFLSGRLSFLEVLAVRCNESGTALLEGTINDIVLL